MTNEVQIWYTATTVGLPHAAIDRQDVKGLTGSQTNFTLDTCMLSDKL